MLNSQACRISGFGIRLDRQLMPLSSSILSAVHRNVLYSNLDLTWMLSGSAQEIKADIDGVRLVGMQGSNLWWFTVGQQKYEVSYNGQHVKTLHLQALFLDHSSDKSLILNLFQRQNSFFLHNTCLLAEFIVHILLIVSEMPAGRLSVLELENISSARKAPASLTVEVHGVKRYFM